MTCLRLGDDRNFKKEDMIATENINFMILVIIKITMEMAMKRMEESREFGCLVYPANNEDAGEFDDENFIDLTSSSEDDIYSSDSDLE